MMYAIADNIESIIFVAGEKEALIYKRAIKEIRLVRNDLIRIDTGDSEVIFHHSQVGSPSTPTAEVLLSVINGWINDDAAAPE